LYGEERLVHFLGLLRPATAEGANHAIVEEVRKFAGEAPQADDITVLSLVYRGRGADA
jgi:sigma-B regulation protein RsbU (phosphoserine phosphatase)